MTTLEKFEKISNSSKNVQSAIKNEILRLGKQGNDEDYAIFIVMLIDAYILEKRYNRCEIKKLLTPNTHQLNALNQ